MKIGFIGLGIMGSRMAANLQKHGYSLVMFNRTRVKAEPLLGPCGTFSDSPAKLAQQVDVLFTMLAHSDAVEQAALGANGFLNHRSGDASCRNMWMLAMGSGVRHGETERPVYHVDVAATAASLLGVDSGEMSGRPAREIL